MNFKIPIRFEVEIDCDIEADSQHDALMKAMGVLPPPGQGALARARFTDSIGQVSPETFEKFKLPDPPDPMEGWVSQGEPDAFYGGRWSIRIGDWYAVVVGDTGPIDVGMGRTTYRYEIWEDGNDDERRISKELDSKEECRDKAIKRIKELS